MTLQDILNIFNFYAGKFSGDTTEEQTQKIRAINIAKDIIVSQLGLPSSEKTFTVSFSEDKEKYVLPPDFLEPISLYYDETFSSIYSDLNKGVVFEYLYPEEIIQKGKYAGVVFWGIDYSDGQKKLFIKTLNSKSGSIIDNCENLSLWTGSNDATALSIDTIRFISGSGSLKFKIDETLSGNQRATLTLNSPTKDFSSFVGIGSFYFQMFMDNPTGVSSVTLSWKTDNSNYWYAVATTNADGNSFQSNSWNELVFNWSDALQVGNPDASNINYFQIDIDYNETTFSSPQYWNIDLLKAIIIDRFTLRYYSENVVSSAGGTPKKDFSATDDIALFANTDASLGNVVAQLGATLYKPLVNKELGQDTSFINSLNPEVLDIYKLRFPKRTPIYYRGKLVNPTLRNK
jgi:hypothetical protein